jgi:aspartate/glutamate/glutamine transport system substrate-binding protein
MKNLKFLFLLVVFCGLSLISLEDGIAGTLQEVKARGRLIAGVRTDVPPFGFMDKRGTAVGIDMDIARALAKDLLGKENAVEFVAVSEMNGARFLEEKKVDILLGGRVIADSPKDVPREVMDYSIPYFESGHLILVRSDSRVSRYQDLAKKMVATVQGSTGDTTVEKLVPLAKRIEFSRPSEAFQALKDKRVDAFVDNYRIIIHFQRINPELKIAGYQPFGSVTYGIGVRGRDQEWIGFVNAALSKMKEMGEYQRLSEKWFAEAMALLLGFEK